MLEIRPLWEHTNGGKTTLMSYDFQTFRGDLFGGITSAIVALPVALAFGLGAAVGIYGAIALGFFTSVLRGSWPGFLTWSIPLMRPGGLHIISWRNSDE